MMEPIYEAVVTTIGREGRAHVAPMGVRYRGPLVVLMPFRPSATLDNILASQQAVLNLVTDTRVFAGCVTGRRDWATVPASRVAGQRLACALGHVELELESLHDDAQRPTLEMRRVFEATHAPFMGLNRAQAAVVEGAVLVSRLGLLSREKVATEMAYLQIAIDKTAAAPELEAWGWLREAVERYEERERK